MNIASSLTPQERAHRYKVLLANLNLLMDCPGIDTTEQTTGDTFRTILGLSLTKVRSLRNQETAS